MQVRPRGAARRTDIADMLALPDLLALAHVKTRGMQERAVQALAVVDDQQLAPEAEILGRKHHHAVGRGDIGRPAATGRDIDARVVALPVPSSGSIPQILVRKCCEN